MIVSRRTEQVQKEKTLKELLEALEKDELIGFLLSYARSDTKFENAINGRFCKPDLEEELYKLEREIYWALEEAYERQRYDKWHSLDFEGAEIYGEIEYRIQQGHIRLAFSAMELLYRKLLEAFSDQEECEIADEIEHYCLDLMAKAADNAVLEEDREYIFKQCIVLSKLEEGKDYGADYEGKLLAIAAKLVTPESFEELEETLALFDSSWREEEFKLIHLEIIRRIRGETAANRFIAENLRFPRIREIAFDEAVKQEDFTEAERLCIDALSPSDQCESVKQWGGYSSRVSPWLYKLYSVHEAIDDLEKMAATARAILFKGDLAYYDKLKSLLMVQDAWNASYAELLVECKAELPSFQYMEILAKEGELVLLMEQVRQHPHSIYSYGEMLAQEYPAEIAALFVGEIRKNAEAAYGRESYRRVCSSMQVFSKAGYRDEALDLIDDLRIRYKRKPAFVDELNKALI